MIYPNTINPISGRFGFKQRMSLVPETNNLFPQYPAINSNVMTSSGINWYDAPTRSQYGFKDWSPNPYISETTHKNWWGVEKPVAMIDHTGAFDTLNQDVNFQNYYKSLPLETQQFVQSTAGNYDWGNFNNAHNQIQQAIQAKQNMAWTPKDTLGAIQTGIGVAASLANIYQSYRQNKLATQELRHKMNLDKANYRNQARSLNAQYRDQLSGRGTTLMSPSAKRRLGIDYDKRKISETF